MSTCWNCGYNLKEGEVGICPNCGEILNKEAKIYMDLCKEQEERAKDPEKYDRQKRQERQMRYSREDDDDDYVAPSRKEEKSHTGFIVSVILLVAAAAVYFFFMR